MARSRKTPRATCELQGYVYDAKIRTARLARNLWDDHTWADHLERDAAELKRRFNKDFWIEDRGFFALALDRNKKKVDSLTSNIGHLLWSGIAEPDKAARCVKHLMSDELFSGWGIRTMATTEGSYNPIGYHVGTVWPHDCSIIAWGLRNYGYRDEAARLAFGILEAAEFFNNRLARGVCRLPARAHQVPSRVSHRVQPASLGDRGTALVRANDARPRLRRLSPHHRPRGTTGDRTAGAARCPRLLGQDGRLRAVTHRSLT